MRHVSWMVLLLACGSGRSTNTPTPAAPPAPADGTEEAAAPAPVTTTTAPARPAAAVEPGDSIVDFEGVIAHTGQPRDKQALLGHPTVVWFFPFAGTPG